MDDIVIRRATDDDLAAAAGLRWEWVVGDKGAAPAVERDAFVDRFVQWALASRTHICFVAVGGRAVVGMAWLALNERVPSPRALDRRNGDVQSVYVLPAFRRRGIASALLAAICETARQSGTERVTVHSSAEAVSTYERAGFESSDLLRHLVLTTH